MAGRVRPPEHTAGASLMFFISPALLGSALIIVVSGVYAALMAD
jgi:hypothetical protein